MNEKYLKILRLPHHESPTRPKMDRVNRAAQFSPFAALVGYEAMIDETNRRTEARVDSGEGDREELDRKFQIILTNVEKKPLVSVTYFVPDRQKEGGQYRTETKCVKRVDVTLRQIFFTDKTSLSLDDVVDFGGELFDDEF